MTPARRPSAPRAFTLVELLIVTLIIVLLSAATIPVIIPAVNQRRVSEAANLVHSELSRARDDAVRSNAPRGIRLMPDAFDPTRPLVLTASRMIAIKPGPTYAEGLVTNVATIDPLYPDPVTFNIDPNYLNPPFLDLVAGTTMIVKEKKSEPTAVPGLNVPTNPTSWYWNIRQGDKLRFEGSNRSYTIVGPMLVGPNTPGSPNPQRFINNGLPQAYPTGPASPRAEFLILLNGRDDDGDGYVDEMFDGIDNDGDGIVDPGFNGVDDNNNGVVDEIQEIFLHRNPDGSFFYDAPGNGGRLSEYEDGEGILETIPVDAGIRYTIQRRPVPTEDAREIPLPSGTVIDLTTWNAPFAVTSSGVPAPSQPERSRLPVDFYTGYVDILIAPNGQVVQSAASSNAAPPVELPYYHFWITDVDDVHSPLWNPPPSGTGVVPPLIANPNYLSPCPERFLLPMPAETLTNVGNCSGTYPPEPGMPLLQAERRIVSLNTKTGQLVTTRAENFSVFNTNRPFQDAQVGSKDQP